MLFLLLGQFIATKNSVFYTKSCDRIPLNYTPKMPLTIEHPNELL